MASEKKITGKKISKLEKQAKGQPSGGGVPINYDIIEKRIKKKIKKYLDDPKMGFKQKDQDTSLAEDRALKEVASDMGASIKGFTPFKSGGRAMYKSGMRVCKLAKRGKGRAYGKNS